MYVINKFCKCQDSFIRMNNNCEATGTFKSLHSGKELKDQILSLDMHGSQMYSQIKYSSQSNVRCGVNFVLFHICFNPAPPEVPAIIPLISVTLHRVTVVPIHSVCPGKTRVIFVMELRNKNQ